MCVGTSGRNYRKGRRPRVTLVRLALECALGDAFYLKDGNGHASGFPHLYNDARGTEVEIVRCVLIIATAKALAEIC